MLHCWTWLSQSRSNYNMDPLWLWASFEDQKEKGEGKNICWLLFLRRSPHTPFISSSNLDFEQQEVQKSMNNAYLWWFIFVSMGVTNTLRWWQEKWVKATEMKWKSLYSTTSEDELQLRRNTFTLRKLWLNLTTFDVASSGRLKGWVRGWLPGLNLALLLL